MNENTNTVETAKDDYPEMLPEGWSGAEGCLLYTSDAADDLMIV